MAAMPWRRRSTDQPDPSTHRKEGERPLVGKPEAVHRPAKPHPPLPLHPEALLGLFAENAMQARKVSHPLHPHVRGNTTMRLPGSENTGLRSVPA